MGGELDQQKALSRAKRVLQIEADAILALRERLGEQVLQLIDMIIEAPGKVVISGVGKSGIAAMKIDVAKMRQYIWCSANTACAIAAGTTPRKLPSGALSE